MIKIISNNTKLKEKLEEIYNNEKNNNKEA